MTTRNGELLIDSLPGGVALSLVESKGGGPKRLVMRGQFARSDRATENKRLYREHLWRREFNRMSEDIRSRGVYGELDHPADGRTKLTRASHLITSLKIEGTEVIGEAEILDTPNGRIIKALAEAGCKVGISSRGFGSTKTLPDGTQEVQEDYHLDTFDFVADPATRTAIPKVAEAYAEETKHIREAEMELTMEILKRDYPGIVEELTRELRENRGTGGLTGAELVESERRVEERLTERFAMNLRRGMEQMEQEVRSQIRSELMSDPEVAGARGIIENIVSIVRPYGLDAQAREEMETVNVELTKLRADLESKALENHRLQQEHDRDRGLMKELAYQLHLERLLANDPSRDAITKIVGDVKKFESKDEITAKVDAIRKELDERGPRRTETDENAEALTKAEEALAAARDRVSALEAEVESARAETGEVQKALEHTKTTAEKALNLSEALEAQLHAERRIATQAGLDDADRDTLRGLCEGVETTARADQIIEGFAPRRTPDNDEAARIRDRVRRGTDHSLTEEHHGPGGAANGHRRVAGPLREVGVDAKDFDRLANTGGRA